MQYLSLVLYLHLQSLTDYKVPLSQGPSYVWRWLVVTVTTGQGLIIMRVKIEQDLRWIVLRVWNQVLMSD